jgi:hypothetical protein
VKSVYGDLSFHLRAGFSIGSIQSAQSMNIESDAGEIASMLNYDILPIGCSQAFHSMIG